MKEKVIPKRTFTYIPTKRISRSYRLLVSEQAYMHTYACNKIFNRKLFENIQFPIDKTFEDVATLPYLIGLLPDNNSRYLSPIIRVTNIGLYLYYWNPKSITNQLGNKDICYLYEGHITTLNKIFEK